jgi:LPXTG-motif cell wall-anchored protein
MPKSPETAVQNIVQNNPTPAPADELAPPPQPAMNELPPPPSQTDLPPPPTDALAANTAPATDPSMDTAAPPPPTDALAANTAPATDPSMDTATPPPPDDLAMAATPPPPAPGLDDKPAKSPAAEGEEVVAEGGDDMMTMLGIGVVLFGALAFVLVKRKKAQAARSNDIHMSNI